MVRTDLLRRQRPHDLPGAVGGREDHRHRGRHPGIHVALDVLGALFGRSGDHELVQDLIVAGFGVTYNQSHLVTTADSCNPDFKSSQDISASGPCRSSSSPGVQNVTGIPNPNHRTQIDLPGHRFSVDDTTIVDLWLSGVVMF